MLLEHEPEAPLAEFYREIEQTPDELNRFPDRLRWTLRAELPPGLGLVSSSAMMIFTSFA